MCRGEGGGETENGDCPLFPIAYLTQLPFLERFSCISVCWHASLSAAMLPTVVVMTSNPLKL